MASIHEQVSDLLRYRESKAEIIEHYQETHGKRWKRELVHDLSGQTGMKPKSLEKRFDPQRRGNPEKKNAEQYRKLGQTLPPIPPSGGFQIVGTVLIKYSGDCEEREVDERITGRDAHDLAAASLQGKLQAVINKYQKGRVSGPGPDSCEEEDGSNLLVIPLY